MPRVVLGISPDKDYYVIWSTVVDNMITTGTQDELQSWLSYPDNSDDRFERARHVGTSAMFWSPAEPFGGYDSGDLMVQARGMLDRRNLLAYAQCSTEEAQNELLTPFEDEEDD